MSNLIRKANELEINPVLKMLIYGQSGIGKTTLALSLSKKTLLFDFDGGIGRVAYSLIGDTGTIQISTYQDHLDVLNSPDIANYDTFVFDTGSKLLDYMTAYITDNDYKMKLRSGGLTQNGYGARKTMFTALIKQISIMKKNIIFIAQRVEKEVREEIKWIPLFGGSSYNDLVAELDLVGYMDAEGDKRALTFTPTSMNEGKNTCNLPKRMEIPVLLDDKGNKILENNFLEKNIYTPFVAKLNEHKRMGIEFENLMKDIEEQIELITDVKSSNNFYLIINDFDHKMNSLELAKRKLHHKATSLGLIFDKTKNKYVLPINEQTNV